MNAGRAAANGRPAIRSNEECRAIASPPVREAQGFAARRGAERLSGLAVAPAPFRVWGARVRGERAVLPPLLRLALSGSVVVVCRPPRRRKGK